jgi:hypothetical protein
MPPDLLGGQRVILDGQLIDPANERADLVQTRLGAVLQPCGNSSEALRVRMVSGLQTIPAGRIAGVAISSAPSLRKNLVASGAT